MAKKQIFRAAALERLSSPEQLDHLMQVTTPRGWLGLGALGGVMAAAVAWSLLGSLPERIHGQGILVQRGGVAEVVSESDGRVVELAVRVGDVIGEGHVIARLAQPELDQKIRQEEARVAELQAQHDRAARFGAADVALQAAHLAGSRGNLEQSIAAGERSLQALAERMKNEERLLSQGLITRQVLLATTEEHERVREKVRAGRAELAQLSVRELQGRNEQQKTLHDSRFRLDEARRELARLQGERRLASAVTSAYRGRVLEVFTEAGRIVTRGEALLTVDGAGGGGRGLEAVVYVPSVRGKRVEPGMEIQIVPSTVQRAEFGSLLGRVTAVSNFPATRGGMQRVLKNQQLVDALSGADAPYEVRAELVPDPRGPGRYRWSSSEGPPIQIRSGTLASASVVVDRRRPISLVIPPLSRYGRARPAADGRVGMAP